MTIKSKTWLFITILCFILIITVTPPLTALEENNDFRNPFNDYRNNKSTNSKVKKQQKEVEVLNKEEKYISIPFKWKGIIAKNERFLVLLINNSNSYFIGQGEQLAGFTLKDITVEKLIFTKDDKKAVLTMESDLNE